MNCPYCNKSIEAMTGFQEVWKFKHHLNTCKKQPHHVVISSRGIMIEPFGMTDALQLRAKSNQ